MLELKPGESQIVRLRLYSAERSARANRTSPSFDKLFALRKREADEFYSANRPAQIDRHRAQHRPAGLRRAALEQAVLPLHRRGLAEGRSRRAAAAGKPQERAATRNWTHLYSRDVLSMPDKWEYPWFAAWDLAFHMIPFARIDGQFAKEQLGLFLREWYMHPNGQIPAYEFAFGDVNPPVHAWAAGAFTRLPDRKDQRDRDFLESVFQKLLINFTWWVNRKDPDGKNLFAGGFLGLDNIGVFDRSKPLPDGGTLRQADGTAWMAFYCVTMLAMALELAQRRRQGAARLRGHGVEIFRAFRADRRRHEHAGRHRACGTRRTDFITTRSRLTGKSSRLKSRSLVGLLPLIAVEILEEDKIKSLPGFYKRFQWFQQHRKDLGRAHLPLRKSAAIDDHRHYLLAIPSRERLARMLRYMLDENEFLSPFGIRSVSKFHRDHPYVFRRRRRSNTGWITSRANPPPDFSAAIPTGAGPSGFPSIISHRGARTLPPFLRRRFQGRMPHRLRQNDEPQGSRPRTRVAPDQNLSAGRIRPPSLVRRRPAFPTIPHWKDLVLFYEYFHGDNGKGLGASHQTGWTALVIRHLEDIARKRARETGQQNG